MMPAEVMSEHELDALREVANVGVAHAANALSQLVGGRPVTIDVPRVAVVALSALPGMLGGPQTRVVAAVLRLEGELTGSLLMVLPDKDARELCAMLLNQPCEGELTELQASALGETANILASACLNAVGRLTGMRLLPSAPRLSHDEVSVIAEDALLRTQAKEGLLVVLDATFQTGGADTVSGQLVVLPDRGGLKTLLGALKA